MIDPRPEPRVANEVVAALQAQWGDKAAVSHVKDDTVTVVFLHGFDAVSHPSAEPGRIGGGAEAALNGLTFTLPVKRGP